MINNWVGIGRLTKDPELRYSGAGTAVTTFTLAVDRGRKTDDGPNADFIPVVTFKQTAEAVANYLRKGKLAAVEGRIQTRNYTNNDGQKIYVTEVIAHNVRFLEKSDTGQRQSSDPFQDNGVPVDISDDNLPF